MKVTAEGVETRYQHDYLQAIGCDELQDYYFSKPLPANEFEALLTYSRPTSLASEGDAQLTPEENASLV